MERSERESLVRLPDIGAASLPIRVSTWLVQLGEEVRIGDRIVELVLPGLTFDVPSPVNGRLIWICANSGDVVKAGDVLGRFSLPDSKQGADE